MGWRQTLPKLISQQYGHCFGWWLMLLGWMPSLSATLAVVTGGSGGFVPAEQRNTFCGLMEEWMWGQCEVQEIFWIIVKWETNYFVITTVGKLIRGYQAYFLLNCGWHDQITPSSSLEYMAHEGKEPVPGSLCAVVCSLSPRPVSLISEPGFLFSCDPIFLALVFFGGRPVLPLFHTFSCGFGFPLDTSLAIFVSCVPGCKCC